MRGMSPMRGMLFASTTLSGDLRSGASTSLLANLLIVGGGGGGGLANNGSGQGGAGGGGGEVIPVSGVTINPGVYAVRVGAGGRGSAGSVFNENGNPSSFLGFTADGGGWGNNSGSGWAVVNNPLRGSGGGGAQGMPTQGVPQTVGFGHQGAPQQGSAGGGGGGWTQDGQGIVGGLGFASTLGGFLAYYGVGGSGGGFRETSTWTANAGAPALGGAGGGYWNLVAIGAPYSSHSGAGGNGVAGCGGGGGGGSFVRTPDNSAGPGGWGGSGTVIIAYPGIVALATGGTITVANGTVIHTFTQNGLFIFNGTGLPSYAGVSLLPTFDTVRHGANSGAFSNGNLRTQFAGTASFTCVFTTYPIPNTDTGKYYLEVDNSALNNANGGIAIGTWQGTAGNGLPNGSTEVAINAANGLQTTGKYGVAVNFATKLCWLRHPTNGWTGAGATAGDPVLGTNGISFAALPSNSMYGIMVCGGNTCIYDINYGQSAFTYPMPTGFALWGLA